MSTDFSAGQDPSSQRLAQSGFPERSAGLRLPGEGVTSDYLPTLSVQMRVVEQHALRMAPSSEPVLILGETGVGKDLLARLIHEKSSRRSRAFVHLNCASLSENLLEAELFGHTRGAYTGATDNREGQFEAAADGTIFLDEIGELPPRLQAKLLHVLQERKIYRIGGRQAIPLEARVIAATNRNLVKDIRSGAFRRDLFYRLSVVTLQIPPLRQRPEDLEPLALHFFQRYTKLYNREDARSPARLSEILMKWTWPGNVRELENLIKRVILLGRIDQLEAEVEALSAQEAEECAPEGAGMVSFDGAQRGSLKGFVQRVVRQTECQLIGRVLEQQAWNRRKAARELGVSYRSLLYKIKEYNLLPQDSREAQDAELSRSPV